MTPERFAQIEAKLKPSTWPANFAGMNRDFALELLEAARPKAALGSLLTEIADRGWLLSNLFQLDSGLWQANLRTATHHTGWGQGLSPELALSAAIDLIAEAIETDQPAPTCGRAALPSHEPMSLASLMTSSRTSFNLRVKL